MERPKTHADRQLERAEALHRQEQQLSGSERPGSIKAADIPDEIERPRPTKHFVFVGVSIVLLLIIAQCISLLSKSTRAKQTQKPAATEAVEKE